MGKRHHVIFVDGPDGSGKTTLINNVISEHFPTTVLDSYNSPVCEGRHGLAHAVSVKEIMDPIVVQQMNSRDTYNNNVDRNRYFATKHIELLSVVDERITTIATRFATKKPMYVFVDRAIASLFVYQMTLAATPPIEEFWLYYYGKFNARLKALTQDFNTTELFLLPPPDICIERLKVDQVGKKRPDPDYQIAQHNAYTRYITHERISITDRLITFDFEHFTVPDYDPGLSDILKILQPQGEPK